MKLLRALPIVTVVVAAVALGLVVEPAVSAGDESSDGGRAIWLRTCAVCHGVDATGTSRGPDISEEGTAAVDFQVRTGRMPLRDPDQKPRRGPSALDEDEIRELVTHTETLMTGPEAGPPLEVTVDLTRGGRGYRILCAACHQSAGAGGALPNGVTAPPLDEADAREVREAIRTGPGSMPRFDPETLDDEELAHIVGYVRHLRRPGDRGGFALGHLGPVPEGLTAIVVGLGVVLLVARWLGTTIEEDAAEEESDLAEHPRSFGPNTHG